jgi:hypothetical protein
MRRDRDIFYSYIYNIELFEEKAIATAIRIFCQSKCSGRVWITLWMLCPIRSGTISTISSDHIHQLCIWHPGSRGPIGLITYLYNWTLIIDRNRWYSGHANWEFVWFQFDGCSPWIIVLLVFSYALSFLPRVLMIERAPWWTGRRGYLRWHEVGYTYVNKR